MYSLLRPALFGALALSALGAGQSALANGEVNLYSYRQPFLIDPILKEFTAETGIQVNTVFARKGMVEKIKAAGDNNPADMVLTVDIGGLDVLASQGLLEPVRSPILEASVPPNLRHRDGLWFALTTRARVVVAHRERVPEGSITRLEDLADPRFKGRICSRSGKHVYNIGLIAAVIARDGLDAAEQWLRGVKANLARKPQGNDRAQVKAIYEGVCDVALINTYYMGKMASNEQKPEQKDWVRTVRVVFLDQDSHGQHVNISGAAVVRSKRDKANAIRLLEFLVSDKAQAMYASMNFEYPVKPGVKTDAYTESLGGFRADTLSLEAIARQRKQASQLVDKVGFDQGP